MAKNKFHEKPSPNPTVKAAGAPAPVAPPPTVAENARKAEEAKHPLPVTIVQPVPEPVLQPFIPPPPVRLPDPPKAAKPMQGLTSAEEILEVEKEIASLQARLWELQHPIIEFPKMVKGHTFKSREEQDKAGPEFRDPKPAKEDK